jgi:hypothetical protein
MQVVQRTSCRICGSKILTPIISLGSQALASAFVIEGSSAALPEREVPLEPEREKSFLERGGSFIVPVPTIQLLP